MKFLPSLAILLLGAIGLIAQPTPTRFTKVVPTITELIASNPNDNMTNAWVMSTPCAAGQAALWQWRAGDATSTDPCMVYASTHVSNPPGRWIKVPIDVEIPVSPGGSSISNYTFITVETIADLKNVGVTNGIQAVQVREFGRAGIFLYEPGSTSNEDGGRVIAPNNETGNPGKWVRTINGRDIYVSWYGQGTNGTIQLAMDYGESIGGAKVILPPEPIYISSTNLLTVRNRVTLEGQTGSALVLYDGPTESYAMALLTGTNAAIKNITWIGWPLEPGAGNTGVGIIVSNCVDCLVGGNYYLDFYTQPMLNGGGNQDFEVYDEQWIYNSVRGYGAVGRADNRQPDDTAAFKFAFDNMTPKTGGSVIIPGDIYALNLAGITNHNGWRLEGLGMAGTGITNAWLIPYNPSNAVVTVGGDATTDFTVRSWELKNLSFDYRSPSYVPGSTNTYGQVGLSIKGGTYEGSLENITVQGFANHNLEFVGATNAAVSVMTIKNVNVFGSNDSGNDGTRLIYAKYRPNNAASGYVTKLSFLSGHLSGGTNGYAIELDAVQLDAVGMYVDAPGGHMYYNNRTTTTSPFPRLDAPFITLDESGANKEVVTNATLAALYPWSGLNGTFSADGGTVSHHDGNSYAMYPHLPSGTNLLYFPFAYGPMVWNRPGTYRPEPHNYFYNDSSANLTGLSTNSYIFTHTNSGFFRITAPTNSNLQIKDDSGTSQISQNAGLFRFIPSALTELRLDNSGASRVISISTNAIADAILISSNGIGILHSFHTNGAMSVKGSPQVTTSYGFGTALTETNLSGSRTASASVMLANPGSTSVVNVAYYGGYDEVGLASSNVRSNQFINSFYARRSDINLRGLTNQLKDTYSFFAGGINGDASNTITNAYDFYSVGNSTPLVLNRWSIYQAGTTASNRFSGRVGFGKDPSVPMDVNGQANATFYTVGSITGPTWTQGAGAPSADAPIGSFYSRTDGGAGTSFYVKEVAGAGAGNWAPK